MTNDLHEFVDDIYHNMVDSNVSHAKAYDDPDTDDYQEIIDTHEQTIVIGFDTHADPSVYTDFVNSLTPWQFLAFHDVLELFRENNHG